MQQQRILTFGNVVMDGMYIMPELPGYDEKVFADDVAWAPGGPSVHFAVVSAKLGSLASVLGWVGDDSIGEQVHKLLEAKGVEPSLHRILHTQTPTSIIMVDSTGEKSVLLSPPIEQSRLPEPEELGTFYLSETNHFHTHLFLESYVECLLRECGRLGISRSIDIEPSSVRRWGTERVRYILQYVDIVFINEGAVDLLCPHRDDLAEKLSCISSWGPGMVICTRGRNGSAVLAGNRYIVSTSFRVLTNNSLAAGDIFAGVFMNKYLEGLDLPDVIRYAAAGSAVAVSRSGCEVYYPSIADIETLMQQRAHDFEVNEVNFEWKCI